MLGVRSSWTSSGRLAVLAGLVSPELKREEGREVVVLAPPPLLMPADDEVRLVGDESKVSDFLLCFAVVEP